MKRPCSQACRLCAKNGSEGACATAITSAVSATNPSPAAARGGSTLSSAASAAAKPSAASACGVLQAIRCCGPKLSAVDSVVASTPSAAAPSTSTSRRQPVRATENASRHGASKPSAISANSPPGESALRFSSASAQPSTQGAIGVSATSVAIASCSFASTWPCASGTGSGNSMPIGQSSSSARPPALRPMNQRSRAVCQRSTPPRTCTQ